VITLLGIAALGVILWTVHKYVRANPPTMAKRIRTVGGVLAIAGAGFLAMRGQIFLAVPLAVTGFGLLVTYFDRWYPGWREHADGGAAAGQVHAPSSNKMTAEEAQQILGVAPGAAAEDISRAHRLLMKKLHPDQGGSTYLAARVNEAKDVLLRRHR
jgi:hypothetical protein